MRHTVRLYVATATLLAFFVLWATIAARPWSAPARVAVDPRLLALTVRERHLRNEALQVKRLVVERWHVYAQQLRRREQAIALARLRHQRELAAAQAAAARIAAAQAAAAASYSAPAASYSPAPAAPSSGAPAAPAAAPATRVVTLPPQVKVVTLPPMASTSSSHP